MGTSASATNGEVSGKKNRTVYEGTSKNRALICAAIDFGTTYTGYSYAFRDKPDDIKTHYWPGNMVKTPTVVLLEPDGSFHAFGKDARSKYESLMEKGQHKDWFLFERFKMQLYHRESAQPLSIDLTIKDIMDKPKPAIDIFTAAIKYIVDHLLKEVCNPVRMKTQLDRHKDIHWVLTVPAIWNDRAKVFMRTAAIQAGIPDDMLTLALEPEAASLYSKYVIGQAAMYVGCRYMILDIGGGTVDITVHEVDTDGNLIELHPPSGGDFGGTLVDAEFLKIVKTIFREDVVERFKQEHLHEYWQLMEDLEVKKKMYNGTGKLILKNPPSLTEMFENVTGTTIDDEIKTKNIKGVEFKQGKIFFSEALGRSMFLKGFDKICEAIEAVRNKVDDLNKVVMVGGFSESQFLELIMTEKFKDFILTSKEPGKAVLHGAVMYGNKPTTIATRICPFTYGIARMVKFKPEHPAEKRVTIDGKDYCDDTFNIHIRKGAKVSVNHKDDAKYHMYYRPTQNLAQTLLQVYASENTDPEFIGEEGCTRIGQAVVELDPNSNMRSEIWIKLIFGGTELELVVKDGNSNKMTYAVFKLF